MRTIAQTVIILVFLLLIVSPAINWLTAALPDTENLENRKPRSAPELDIQHLDPFPEKFEAFFNDNFTNRNRLIKWYNDFKLRVFNKSAFPDQVIIGDEKWLFLAQSDIDDYTGKNGFTAQQLQDFKKELEYRRSVLDSMGCKFYFAVAPGKPNIYPEMVPVSFFKQTELGWGETLLKYLKENSDLSICDLYPVLRAAKKEHPVYYKLDTHWNNWGALEAGRSLVQKIQSDNHFQGDTFPAFRLEKKLITSEGNCAKILGFPTFFANTEFVMQPVGLNLATKKSEREFIKQNQQRPSVMICGDSFTSWLLPYVSQGFGYTNHDFDLWKYKFNRKEIMKQKPDVYLLLIHEPLLKQVLENRSRN